MERPSLTIESPIAPMPVPADARAVLLFGGTFDPVHRAHVEVAAAARDRILGSGAWLVLVPAARNPLKADGPTASGADRVAMLAEALRTLGCAAVWTDELDRSGPSYWVDTMRRARAAMRGGPALRFLIGADHAAGFHHWKAFRTILSLGEPIVLARRPWETWESLEAALVAAGCWSPAEVIRWRGWFFGDFVIDSSATEVRAALAAGDPRVRSRLDPGVMKIIEERGLYRTE